nr:30S ribosomal S20 domain protein [Burkholderia pseudomallei MSHR4868]
MRIAALRASPQRRFAVKRVGRPRLKPTFFLRSRAIAPGSRIEKQRLAVRLQALETGQDKEPSWLTPHKHASAPARQRRQTRTIRRCARNSAPRSRPFARRSTPAIRQRPPSCSRPRRRRSTRSPTRRSFTRTRPLATRAASPQPSRACRHKPRSKSPARPLGGRPVSSCDRQKSPREAGFFACRLSLRACSSGLLFARASRFTAMSRRPIARHRPHPPTPESRAPRRGCARYSCVLP